MQIILEEQGLRDGLQNLPQPLPTERKLAIVHRLIEAGLRRIQVVSFVHPRLVPQMADAEALCRQLPDRPDVVFSGLVLNLRGVERGIAAGLRHLACSMSASDTHSRKNTRMSLPEARRAFAAMIDRAHAAGVTVRAGIQCALGCRYEGRIDPEVVLDLVRHHLDAGAGEIALADSTGMGHPAALGELVGRALELANDRPVFLHLHDTEGKGSANVCAALAAGARHFDVAFGGLGGCPFIRSATGNIATEDTAHLLHQLGHHTGIDIGGVAGISRELSAWLGHPLPGRMYGLWDQPEIQVI